MVLRNSKKPPLQKFSNQQNVEPFLHRKETQTLEELAAIKDNFDDLISEVFLVRQRILDKNLYNDYLLPFVGKYLYHKMCKYGGYYGSKVDIGEFKLVVSILPYAFKLQHSSVKPSIDRLKERIKWVEEVCVLVKWGRTVNINVCVFGAILDSIEEFYKCEGSGNAYITRETYVNLLDFLLYCCHQCVHKEKRRRRHSNIDKEIYQCH